MKNGIQLGIVKQRS